MATVIELDGKTPQIAEDAFIAPTAVLIGDVTVGARAPRSGSAPSCAATTARSSIGAGSNVQDNCVIHCADDLPTIVGENVTVGHMAMLEGCVIGDGSLIGMGAIVLQRANVGAGSLVAAGAVVGEGVEIPEGVLAAGDPGEGQEGVGRRLTALGRDGSARVPVQAAALHAAMSSAGRESQASRRNRQASW